MGSAGAGVTPTPSPSPRALRFAPALLLAAFAALGLATAFRGIDAPDWREADIAAIARNFSRESMNPLTPRIDWRGDGPGITEMEPPLLPFAMALLEPWTGEDPRVGRLLSLAASLGGFALFLGLARERLHPLGAAVAGAFYALCPLQLSVATELRPEPWMLLGYLASIRYALRWLRFGARRDRARALAGTAFAVFAKLPALHLGLLLSALALRQRGARALRDRELWAFAGLSVLPAALWYAYARSLWLRYGNSMGLSNQDHFAGLDLLAQARPLVGLLRTEIGQVFTLPGALAILLAAALGAWRRWRDLELWWLAALALYLVATAPTTGEAWAAYYHVVAVPLAALMLGSAAETFVAAPASGGRGACVRAAGCALVLVALSQSLLGTSALVAQRIPGGAAPDALWRCAERFAESVPAGQRILVSAGRCRDAGGRRIAHNRPYLFYWMDRQGFQPCQEELSLEVVQRVAERGATFFAAERRHLRESADLEARLRGRYPVRAECDAALLFDLRGPPQPGRGTAGSGG